MKLKYEKFPNRSILKETLKEVVLSKQSRFQTITQIYRGKKCKIW